MFKKRGTIDIEFLVNLIRGVLVLFVLFIIAASIYSIFISDNNQERVYENFLGFVEIIEYMPPNSHLTYALDLGDPEQYSIVDTITMGGPIIPQEETNGECRFKDCLCLCEGVRKNCENPRCVRVTSKIGANIDANELDLHQFWSSSKDYVEINYSEKEKEMIMPARVLLRRTGNEVAICRYIPGEPQVHDSCLRRFDASIADRMLDDLSQSLERCGKNSAVSSLLTPIIDEKTKQQTFVENIYQFDSDTNQVCRLETQEDKLEKSDCHKLDKQIIPKWNLKSEDETYDTRENLGYMFLYKTGPGSNYIVNCDEIEDPSKFNDYYAEINTEITNNKYSVGSGFCIDGDTQQFLSTVQEFNINFETQSAQGPDADIICCETDIEEYYSEEEKSFGCLEWTDLNNLMCLDIPTPYKSKSNPDSVQYWQDPETNKISLAMNSCLNNFNIPNSAMCKEEYETTQLSQFLNELNNKNIKLKAYLRVHDNSQVYFSKTIPIKRIIKTPDGEELDYETNKELFSESEIQEIIKIGNLNGLDLKELEIYFDSYTTIDEGDYLYLMPQLFEDESNKNINKISLTTGEIMPLYDEEGMKTKQQVFIKEEIQDLIKTQGNVICREEIENTLPAEAINTETGEIEISATRYSLVIEKNKAYIEYEGVKGTDIVLPTNLDCVIYTFAPGSNEEYKFESNAPRITITPADQNPNPEIVDIGIGEPCLWLKKPHIEFK